MVLKLNSEEEKELIKTTYPGESLEEENPLLEQQQEKCLLLLEERARQYPAVITQWEAALLKAGSEMDEIERKVKTYLGIFGGCVVVSILLMLVVVLLIPEPTIALLTTGIILLIMTVGLVFLFLGIKWLSAYGIHSDKELFQKYIRKYGIVTLKAEMDALLRGIREMKELCSRAKEDIQKINKGECLSEEEYQWASVPMEERERPKHTENLVENLLKWESEF